MNRRSFISAAAAGVALAAAPAADAKAGSHLRPIPLSDLTILGEGIKTPETVVAGRDGSLYVTDPETACAVIAPDGSVSRVGKAISALGLALDREERVVIANFGLGRHVAGSLQRLDPKSGALETLVESVNGRQLVASNNAVIAADGAIYCTHTSWGPTTDACINPAVANGFIYRLDPNGQVSVVCEGLHGPNGLCLDAEERHLYVAQTSGGNLVRLSRRGDGSFGPPQFYGPQLGLVPRDQTVQQILAHPVAERSRMGHPDGIALDAEGNVWVALVFANKVVAVTPQGKMLVVIDDPEGKLMAAPSSIAWGGPDLTDLYIGMIGKPHIIKAKSPVPGLPLANQRP